MKTVFLFASLCALALASDVLPSLGEECCATCPEGQKKYFSVNHLFNMCGECCIDPKDEWKYKIFEFGLTPATDNSPCKEHGYSAYKETTTHGAGPIKMTLDLYKPSATTNDDDDFVAKAPIVQESGYKGFQSKLPTVFMHGMGDSCFNPGMKSITAAVGNHVGTYAVCVPTGPDLESDTNNGFFMTMNDNVDVFAKAIKADPKLANGFNAVGFSQGNSVIRGYIQKYNNPPVSTFLSVHGTVVGVAAFPKCSPTGLLGPVCRLLAKLVVGPGAYTEFVQKGLFQADYFRQPSALEHSSYKTNSELAQWNNEGDKVDPTINANFAKVKRWAMIKAEKDTMIYPNDGEWWGQFDPKDQTKRLAMNETEWYQKDLFGLKTADEAGKIQFDSSPGDHLQFTEKELFGWVDKFFLE